MPYNTNTTQRIAPMDPPTTAPPMTPGASLGLSQGVSAAECTDGEPESPVDIPIGCKTCAGTELAKLIEVSRELGELIGEVI